MRTDLDPDEQRFLLELARETISAQLGSLELPSPTPDEGPLTEVRGAFVTLNKGEALRGCIGHVQGVAPLWRSVRDNAIAAAFHDPRFGKVTADELDEITIDISALTPLERIGSVDEIEVGRHGLVLRQGGRRGLLLPQVASERGWDRETFLEATCRKAYLREGSWKHPDCEIYIFSAQVFSER